MAEKRRRFKFPFRKSYTWNAQITVDLPEQLGNERRVFHVKGEKTFEFYATQDADLAALKLTDLRLTVPETHVVLSRPGQYWIKPIDIRGLTIGPEAIDLKGSEGFVNLDTGYFTLQFRIHLTPKIVPLMEEYKIEEMPLLVQEAGQLDLGEGSEYQSWLHFGIAPEYTGEFRPRSGGGGKSSCPTTTVICATVDGSPCQSPGTVYICPGEDVHLWWDSSEDVTDAEITPDVGSVSPSGHTVVRPTSTTDYTITVRGECERSASVHVRVIREGDTIDITAPPTPACECWQLIVPETRCSRNIKITSIAPQCGLGCFIHQPPIIGYLYLDCGGGSMCDGQWSAQKEDLDGHLHFFNTGLFRMNLPDIPFAGTWQFWPLAEPWQLHGNAYFLVTAKCS